MLKSSKVIGPVGSGGPLETGHVICPACAHNFPAIPENARERIAELEEEMQRVLNKYDEENPARTADYHLVGCGCLRCCIDDARATLTQSVGS